MDSTLAKQNASLSDNPSPLVSHESLKVYIRVRPKLKSEYLKEIAAFTDTDVGLYVAIG
jgi:hypothetical protein